VRVTHPEPQAYAETTGTSSEVAPTSGTYRRRVTLEAVPRLRVSPTTLRSLPLDHRAGFLVWLIDGVSTVEAILDACPMTREHVLAMLGVLAAHGVISLDDA
jgi:hypothetical protein